MRINHNIAAMNTYRQLGQANDAQSKSMEKLSSGLRINNASDDAAGLSISEKMRGQIRGLEQASTNAQDANSLIQTAEGALNESHSILQRMRELAVQSANDTNTETDRGEIQKEVDQLTKELTRIGNSTEFNTQNLLDGSFKGTFQIGANEGQNIGVEMNDMRGFELGMAGDYNKEVSGTYTAGGSTDELADGSYSVEDGATAGDFNLVDGDGATVATSTDGTNFTATDDDGTIDNEGSFALDSAVTAGTTIEKDGTTVTAQVAFTNDGLEAGDYTVSADGSQLLNSNDEVVATHDSTNGYANDDGVVLANGATALTGGIELTVGGIDVSSQTTADSAITKINDAIETVSSERSKLGAVQNRLDHTINNLGTSSENLTAAESRIRDVDYALAAA